MKSLNYKTFFAFLALTYFIFITISINTNIPDDAIKIATIISPFFGLIGYFIVEIQAENRSILEKSIYYQKSIDDTVNRILLEYDVKDFQGQKSPQYLVGAAALEKYCLWLKMGFPSHICEPSIRPEKLTPIIVLMDRLVDLYKSHENILYEDELLFYHRYFLLMSDMNQVYDYIKKNKNNVYIELKFGKLQEILNNIIKRKESR